MDLSMYSYLSHIRNGLSENQFLERFYNLYETTYFPKKTLVHSWKRHFDKPFEVNLDLIDQIYQAEKFIESVKTTVPTYDELYSFGTFIKTMEKLYMYRNDKDAFIACDNSLEDKKRNLVLHAKNAFIAVNMQEVDGKQIIDLFIRREFGKKMETRYNIVNRQMEFESDDDMMAIAHINNTLQDMAAKFFISWCNLAITKQLVQYTMNPDNIYGRTDVLDVREALGCYFTPEHSIVSDDYWAYEHIDDIHFVNQK